MRRGVRLRNRSDAVSFGYDDILRECFKPNAVFLYYSNGNLPSFALMDVADDAGLAFVRTANDFTEVTVFYAHIFS